MNVTNATHYADVISAKYDIMTGTVIALSCSVPHSLRASSQNADTGQFTSDSEEHK